MSSTLPPKSSFRPGAEAVFQSLSKLVALPAEVAVVEKALEVTADPFRTNERLEQILSSDAGAAADLLRLANSAYFGVGTQVRTLATAIAVVGHDRLRTLLRHLLAVQLLRMIPSERPEPQHVRKVGLAAAATCHLLGETSVGFDPDELLLGGLLHNVGELALVAQLPELYAQVFDLRRSISQRQAEIAVFGVDSSVVSRWLLDRWHFPKIFLDTVMYWENPTHRDVEATSVAFLATIHIAARLAAAWVAELQADVAVKAILNSNLELAGVEPANLAAIYDKIGPRLKGLQAGL